MSSGRRGPKASSASWELLRVATSPDTFESRCVGACAADSQVVITGAAAARLWGFRHVFRPDSPIVLVTGKGGVGKSSVSVNLAISLAEKGFKVGLMDVDIHGPDIPRMLGLMGMLAANTNRKLAPMRTEVSVMSPPSSHL